MAVVRFTQAAVHMAKVVVVLSSSPKDSQDVEKEAAGVPTPGYRARPAVVHVAVGGAQTRGNGCGPPSEEENGRLTVFSQYESAVLMSSSPPRPRPTPRAVPNPMSPWVWPRVQGGLLPPTCLSSMRLFPQLLGPRNSVVPFVARLCRSSFPVIRGWGWYRRDADGCPAISCPSLQFVTLMHRHRHGCLGLNNALLCCLCLFTVRAKYALVRTTGGVASVIFGALPLFLPVGGGGGGGTRPRYCGGGGDTVPF